MEEDDGYDSTVSYTLSDGKGTDESSDGEGLSKTTSESLSPVQRLEFDNTSLM